MQIFWFRTFAEEVGLALQASKQIFSFTKRRKLGADIFFDKLAANLDEKASTFLFTTSHYLCQGRPLNWFHLTAVIGDHFYIRQHPLAFLPE